MCISWASTFVLTDHIMGACIAMCRQWIHYVKPWAERGWRYTCILQIPTQNPICKSWYGTKIRTLFLMVWSSESILRLPETQQMLYTSEMLNSEKTWWRIRRQWYPIVVLLTHSCRKGCLKPPLVTLRLSRPYSIETGNVTKICFTYLYKCWSYLTYYQSTLWIHVAKK